MSIRIDRLICICFLLALALLAGCSNSTTTNNRPTSSNGLPMAGSIFVYTDSALNLQTGQFEVVSESDTVLQSGVTIQGQTKIVGLSANTRTFLYYTRTIIDSMLGSVGSVLIQSELDTGGPPHFAITSSGDLSIPGASITVITTNSSGQTIKDDSGVEWFTYPIKTQTANVVTSEQWPSPTDSIGWAQPANFIVQGSSLQCEHAVRIHHNYIDSTLEGPQTKTDIYFSPTLGMPVAMIVNMTDANGDFVPIASKHLVQH